MSYCKLTTAELQAEQTKQHEIVHAASPDNSLDELQKLFVIEALLAYRESHADRLKRQPAKGKGTSKGSTKGSIPPAWACRY
jgi:hypothetical protein